MLLNRTRAWDFMDRNGLDALVHTESWEWPALFRVLATLVVGAVNATFRRLERLTLAVLADLAAAIFDGDGSPGHDVVDKPRVVVPGPDWIPFRRDQLAGGHLRWAVPKADVTGEAVETIRVRRDCRSRMTFPL